MKKFKSNTKIGASKNEFEFKMRSSWLTNQLNTIGILTLVLICASY